MNGTYLLALIAFIWFVMIMWKDILKLLTFIRIKKLEDWILSLEGDKRSRGLFLLTGFSISLISAYVIFYWEWMQKIPHTLLVVLVSAPVAWGLWVWRNKDKHIDLEHEERKLKNDELIANTNDLIRYMETISDKNSAIEIKTAAANGLKSYISGDKGKEFFSQTVVFVSSFFNELQRIRIDKLNKKAPGNRLFQTFNNIIRFGIQTDSDFKKEFSQFDLSEMVFMDAMWQCSFVGCSFFKAHFFRVTFENVSFERCFFKKCAFLGAMFKNCTFKNCTFTGNTFSSISFIDCTFKNVELKNSIFNEVLEEKNNKIEKSMASPRSTPNTCVNDFLKQFDDDNILGLSIFHTGLPNFHEWQEHLKESN